ncbi:Coatomer subunit gamma-2 [Triplophysa tibetana]|uniref:Coatomer subunit gamma-2 n=1 Tax=Triplophysa tibetana TaxID=1572043 RepID=A0A5A9PGY1_9TELE|nr:Coatomer subunit gamma-2 [Triplophysa tibetana]
MDLENLITDSNCSIGTLLKTGSESSVDRLMKQISSFVSEISDEFKVTESLLQHIIQVLFYTLKYINKVPESKNSHVLFLAGVFRRGHDVLVRSRLALADGVTMQVTVRSSDENVVDVILASLG